MIEQECGPPGYGREEPILATQPGGGWGMRVELAWGRLRRRVLRKFCPGYVAAQLALREGACPGCPGRPLGCQGSIIDSRDLKYFSNVCGYRFPGPDRFAWRGRLPFARWGLAELLVFSIASLLLALAVGWLAWLGLPNWAAAILTFMVFLFWLEILWFFRNPERRVPDDASLVLSPADGKVVEVAEVEADGFADGALRIGIFLSIFNVHINRAPVAARVTQLRYFPGKFLSALKPACAQHNEQLWIDMEQEGTKMPVRVTQISGALARRIVCELRAGQVVQKGEAFGMIKLGSRTELYVPAGAHGALAVKVGDMVKAGETVLIRLEHRA